MIEPPSVLNLGARGRKAMETACSCAGFAGAILFFDLGGGRRGPLRWLYASFTVFSRVPSPLISRRIVSPGCSVICGLRENPTPAGGAAAVWGAAGGAPRLR